MNKNNRNKSVSKIEPILIKNKNTLKHAKGENKEIIYICLLNLWIFLSKM